MAGALSPVLNAGIQGQSPVQQVSGLASAADLIGSFANSLSQAKGSGPSLAERTNQLEAASRQSLLQAYQEANQLREQGFTQKATERERMASIEYYKATGKNPLDDAGKTAYQSATGQDPSLAGKSFDQVQIDNIRGAPEYGMFYQAAPKEMSEEEKDRYAIAQSQQLNVDKANVARSASEWRNGGETSALRVLDTTTDAAIKTLAKSDGPVDPEFVMNLRAQYEAFKATYRPPAGLSEQDLSRWNDSLAKKDELFKVLDMMYGPESQSIKNKQTNAKFYAHFADVYERANPTLAGAATASVIRSGDVQVISGLILQNGVQGTVQALNEVFSLPYEGISNRATTEPESVVSQVQEAIANKTPEEKYSLVTSTSKLFNSTDISKDIKSDPKARDDWFLGTLTSFEAMQGLSSEDQLNWIASGDYGKVFSPEMMKNIKALAETDPASAGLLYAEAQHALAEQRTVLAAHLSSMEAQGGGAFIWDQTQGTFRVNPNPEGYIGRLGGQGPAALQDVINRFYSGDINGLIKDKGAKLRRYSMMPDTQVLNPVTGVSTPAFSQDKERVKNVFGVLEAYFRLPVVANSVKYAEALKANEQYTQMFGRESQGTYEALGIYNPFAPVAPEEETDEVFSMTIRSDRNIENIHSVTANIMDRHEGGGDYSTLFGHSQREGNPFAGVDVSKMTIAEALDFANPSGPYGQWVKSELARLGQRARVSTPMGRFQFVGSTLREIAREMGLDINNTVFNAETQNAMFNHYANKILSGKEGASARKAMRDAWEGFKNVDDATLDQAIAEIKGGGAVFGPASTYGGTSSPVSTLTPQSGLLPPMEGKGDALELPQGGSGGATQVEGMDPAQQQGTPAGEPVTNLQGTTASQASSQQANAQIAAESQEVLQRLGLSSDTPVFNTYQELLREVRKGAIPEGSTVVVNGEAVEV